MLIPIKPHLPVKVTRVGSSLSNALTEAEATLIEAGTDFFVVNTNTLPASWVWSTDIPYRIAGDGFEFDVALGASTATHLTLKLIRKDQQPTFDALIGSQRKSHHIDICAKQDVESSDRDNGLSKLGFMPCALPEMSWDECDTRVRFLGREFAAPLLITGMTGGVERGQEINHNLAKAAAAARIPMGVGSQRLALEDATYAAVFDVKRTVPDVFLIANIGAAQIASLRDPGKARELCLRTVKMIAADALAIHVNVLQELIQIEGDRDFRGVLSAVAAITRDFPVPVIVKEVGTGMDPTTVRRLAETGVAAIDVGGRGGTSWGWIEGLRANNPELLELARSFRDWGLTTGSALNHAVTALAKMDALPNKPALIATGGIRTGVDVAKVIALGASMAGVGLPLFRAALKNSDEVTRTIEQILRGLKTVMMCTGSRKLADLEQALTKRELP
jgi:isopentenyl-diphosphate delta-isomerase